MLVAFGAIAIIVPGAAALAVTVLLGWLFLLSGILGLVTTIWMRQLPGFWWSLLTCGEALHNNHHHIQNAVRFSMRRGELDPGYWYFSGLRALGLARTRQEARA